MVKESHHCVQWQTVRHYATGQYLGRLLLSLVQLDMYLLESFMYDWKAI